MREVFVQNNSVNQGSVFQGTTNLSFNLDQLKVDVLAGVICDRQNSLDTDLGDLVCG